MSEFPNLIDAVKQGKFEHVIAIIDVHEKFANQFDKSGANPLHYAALNGHRDIVRLLVERGANVNSTDGEFGATPAGWAIEYA